MEKNIYFRAEQTTQKIWSMRIARWIPKDSNTLSEYVIPIAFPLQQLLQKSASMLRKLFLLFLLQGINPQFLVFPKRGLIRKTL